MLKKIPIAATNNTMQIIKRNVLIECDGFAVDGCDWVEEPPSGIAASVDVGLRGIPPPLTNPAFDSG